MTKVVDMQQAVILEKQATASDDSQYSLVQIIGLWAMVALPMFFLAWVIAPALAPYSPFHPGITYWLLIIVGMIWQFVFSLIILYREMGTLNIRRIRERTWLTAPEEPKTGKKNYWLFLWVIPAILFNGLVTAFSDIVDVPWVNMFPFLAPRSFMDIAELATPEFHGAWWLLGIVLLSSIFNYFLGEELFFHGVLLPKVKGAFGKWDWVANAVFFGLYHLHKPWAIPGIIVSCLSYSLPATRFKSNWMAVIVHGFEGIILFIIVLGIILGLAG